MLVNRENLDSFRQEFLKLEKRRWECKKQGNMEEFSDLSHRLSGSFGAILSLGLEKEFGIRRAGPYFKLIEE